MSFYDNRGRLVEESRMAGGPGDIDLDSEEYSPDDYESDYFEDELGDHIEDLFEEMQDRVEDMLDGFNWDR